MSKKSKNPKQPRPKKGKVFYGYAPANWGLIYGNVHRTKREAIEECISNSNDDTWEKAKKYMAVAKVKCEVL